MLTAPNRAAALTTHQSRVDSGEIDALIRGVYGHGVMSTRGGVGGLQVVAQSGMNVQVTPGSACANGTLLDHLTGTTGLAISAAHASLNRLDLVVVDSAESYSVLTGTPSQLPVWPSVADDEIVLGEVAVLPGATEITSSHITDKRMPVPWSTEYFSVRDYDGGGSNLQVLGSITSGTAIVTTTTAHDYIPGEYVAIRGAGASHGIAQPSAPTVTPDTTESGAYTYAVSFNSGMFGETQASSETTIANGPNTLSSSDTITVTRPGSAGDCDSWNLYGRTSGSMFLIAHGISGRDTQFVDRGDTVGIHSVDYTTLAFRVTQKMAAGELVLHPFNASGLTYRVDHVRWYDTNARTTGGSAPTFNTTLGDTTASGGVVFRRENIFCNTTPITDAGGMPDALFARVASVESNTQFTIDTNALNTTSGLLVTHDDTDAFLAAEAAARAAPDGRKIVLVDGDFPLQIGSASGEFTASSADARITNFSGSRYGIFNPQTGLTWLMTPNSRIRVKTGSVDANTPAGGYNHVALFGYRDSSTEGFSIRALGPYGRITWEPDGAGYCSEAPPGTFENGWWFLEEPSTIRISSTVLEWLEIDGFPHVYTDTNTRGSHAGATKMLNCRIPNFGGADDTCAFTEGFHWENCYIDGGLRFGASRVIYDSLDSPPGSRLIHCDIDGGRQSYLRLRSPEIEIRGGYHSNCDTMITDDNATRIVVDGTRGSFLIAFDSGLGHQLSNLSSVLGVNDTFINISGADECVLTNIYCDRTATGAGNGKVLILSGCRDTVVTGVVGDGGGGGGIRIDGCSRLSISKVNLYVGQQPIFITGTCADLSLDDILARGDDLIGPDTFHEFFDGGQTITRVSINNFRLTAGAGSAFIANSGSGVTLTNSDIRGRFDMSSGTADWDISTTKILDDAGAAEFGGSGHHVYRCELDQAAAVTSGIEYAHGNIVAGAFGAIHKESGTITPDATSGVYGAEVDPGGLELNNLKSLSWIGATAGGTFDGGGETLTVRFTITYTDDSTDASQTLVFTGTGSDEVAAASVHSLVVDGEAIKKITAAAKSTVNSSTATATFHYHGVD